MRNDIRKTFMFEWDLSDFSLRSHFCTFINKINLYIIDFLVIWMLWMYVIQLQANIVYHSQNSF